MSETLELMMQANALLATLARVDRASLSDPELCHLVALEEQGLRLLSTGQVFSAAEVDDRSRFELGDAGLSMRNSFRKAIPFLEHLTRAPQADLTARVRLGQSLRTRVGLTGEILPPLFPVLADGMRSGLVSPEAATSIIRSLTQAVTGSEATPERLDAAEHALTDQATVESVDLVRAAARVWRDALDPDGIEPRYDEILGQRGLRRGRERNGITGWSLATDPRTTALIDAILNEATAPGATPRFMSDEDRTAGTSTILDDTGEEVEILADLRTRPQKHLDILAGVLTAGLRASHDATPDLRATATVTATVTLAELEAGVGTAWLTGAHEPIPVRALQQMICDTGLRITILGLTGQPLYETVHSRYFTPTQRRAMLTRDGDQCVGPGCHNPAAWCEAHHVTFHHDGGPTTLDNGALLCPSCHTALHNGAFQLRMHDGIPHYRLSIHAADDTAWRPAGNPRHHSVPARHSTTFRAGSPPLPTRTSPPRNASRPSSSSPSSSPATSSPPSSSTPSSPAPSSSAPGSPPGMPQQAFSALTSADHTSATG